jgi:signal transduction histidine kinase
LTVDPATALLTVHTAGVPGTRPPGTGSGLVSMRERAEVLGGGCTAGPVAGGWRVTATIPLGAGVHAKAYP